jgi:hypothetical protein
MTDEPVRRQDDYTFTTMSAVEARADAERYWLSWRTELASVKPFTLGFPDLTARYDPDKKGEAPLGTLCCDAEPDGTGRLSIVR